MLNSVFKGSYVMLEINQPNSFLLNVRQLSKNKRSSMLCFMFEAVRAS